jgi:hypothetical protein
MLFSHVTNCLCLHLVTKASLHELFLSQVADLESRDAQRKLMKLVLVSGVMFLF